MLTEYSDEFDTLGRLVGIFIVAPLIPNTEAEEEVPRRAPVRFLSTRSEDSSNGRPHSTVNSRFILISHQQSVISAVGDRNPVQCELAVGDRRRYKISARSQKKSKEIETISRLLYIYVHTQRTDISESNIHEPKGKAERRFIILRL